MAFSLICSLALKLYTLYEARFVTVRPLASLTLGPVALQVAAPLVSFALVDERPRHAGRHTRL